MTRQPTGSFERPLGVSLLALFLFMIGSIFVLAGIVLPFLGSDLMPWYISAGGAAYFFIVGWGLWGGRRWAYFAALLMCVVLGFYLVQVALVLQRNVLFPFLLLAAICAYLLRSPVRLVFLRPANPPRE